MSLADDVAADPVKIGGKGKFVAFLDSLSKQDKEEAIELLKTPDMAGKVHRALEKRGWDGAESTVFAHARRLRQQQ